MNGLLFKLHFNQFLSLTYFQVLSSLEGKSEDENAVELQALLSNPHFKVSINSFNGVHYNSHCVSIVACCVSLTFCNIAFFRVW